jgi:hypothetical protein
MRDLISVARQEEYAGLRHGEGFANQRAYSISRSARISRDRGIVMPIRCAVFILMTNSNFVGRSTGSSAGFAPFKIFAM